MDLVLSGLPQDKAEPKRTFWRGFAKRIQDNLPNTLHAREDGSFFGEWDVYDWNKGVSHYVVSDLNLVIPNQKSSTMIHFMIYRSDERFGKRITKRAYDKLLEEYINISHTPSANVNRDMWKAQQKKDDLPYLAIAEF